MNPDHQHFFIVRTVEDTDLASLREQSQGTPEIVVIQFLDRRRFERMHLAALRIYARHHMLNGAILAGCVHGLKDEQHAPAVLGVELVLQLGQRRDARSQKLLGLLFGVYFPGAARIKILQPELRSILDPVRLRKFACPTHASLHLRSRTSQSARKDAVYINRQCRRGVLAVRQQSKKPAISFAASGMSTFVPGRHAGPDAHISKNREMWGTRYSASVIFRRTVAIRCDFAHYVSGYFAGYLPNLKCYVYGPFGRCTTGVGLLP